MFIPRHQISLFSTNGPGLIAAFKAYHLRQTFIEFVRIFDRSGKTRKDYWRSFDILKVIKNINAVWEEVSVNCLTGVRLELLSQFVHHFVRSEPIKNMAEYVRRLAQEAGLDEVRDFFLKYYLLALTL